MREGTSDRKAKFFNRLVRFNTAFVGKQFIFDEHPLLSVINPRGRQGPLIFALGFSLVTQYQGVRYFSSEGGYFMLYIYVKAF